MKQTLLDEIKELEELHKRREELLSTRSVQSVHSGCLTPRSLKSSAPPTPTPVPSRACSEIGDAEEDDEQEKVGCLRVCTINVVIIPCV